MTAQNFLTQMVDPASAPISYMLGFAQAARAVRVLRAPLRAATKSGVTHPAWQVTALDAAGKPLAENGEALLGSFTTIPEKMVRPDSSGRAHDRGFAHNIRFSQ